MRELQRRRLARSPRRARARPTSSKSHTFRESPTAPSSRLPTSHHPSHRSPRLRCSTRVLRVLGPKNTISTTSFPISATRPCRVIAMLRVSHHASLLKPPTAMPLAPKRPPSASRHLKTTAQAAPRVLPALPDSPLSASKASPLSPP